MRRRSKRKRSRAGVGTEVESIALVKRVPLDMIVKMRKESLSEHLRGVVPMLND